MATVWTGRPALQCVLTGHVIPCGDGFCSRPGCQAVALPGRKAGERPDAYRERLTQVLER